MKISKYSYRVCFLLFFVITLLEFILIEAFSWAGFHGFGDVPMVYTGIGVLAIYLWIFFPGSALVIFNVIMLCRLKPPIGALGKYILTALSGIGAGIIIFQLDTYTIRILWQLIKIIIYFLEHSAWMEYPAP